MKRDNIEKNERSSERQSLSFLPPTSTSLTRLFTKWLATKLYAFSRGSSSSSSSLDCNLFIILYREERRKGRWFGRRRATRRGEGRALGLTWIWCESLPKVDYVNVFGSKKLVDRLSRMNLPRASLFFDFYLYYTIYIYICMYITSSRVSLVDTERE